MTMNKLLYRNNAWAAPQAITVSDYNRIFPLEINIHIFLKGPFLPFLLNVYKTHFLR